MKTKTKVYIPGNECITLETLVGKKLKEQLPNKDLNIMVNKILDNSYQVKEK